MKQSIKLFWDFDIDASEYPRTTLLVVALAYFLFLLPVLPQESTYHSDERFYTDAATYMVQHQDYLTPYYADGSLRLNKPVVTYWALIAGYAACGMGYFGARLPFLLAGCLCLWVTYHLSMGLFGRRRDALLAATIAASNVQLITLSVRATPDILQALLINLSLYGFITIVLNKDLRLRSYLWAYGGASLAAATKGFLGAVPVGFVFLYAWFLNGKPGRFKNLLHWPVMLAAAALALAWFAIMYLQHGQAELGRFYQDQMGERLSSPSLLFLLNLKDHLWGIVRYFMPWCLVVFAGYWSCRLSVNAYLKQHHKAVAFILGWAALLLLIFASGNISRTRYLIPAYPLLAVLCASLFMQVFQDIRVQGLWRWICGGILMLLMVIGSLLTAAGVLLHWRLVAAGVLLGGTAAPGMWLVLRGSKVFSPLMVSMHLLLATACTHFFVLPVFESVPSRQVAEAVLQDQAAHQTVSIWSERKFKFAGQLYLLSKGRIKPFYFPNGNPPRELDQRPLALLSQKTIGSMQLTDYEVAPCGMVSRPAKAGELWTALRSGGRQAFFKALQEPCYLARRKTNDTTSRKVLPQLIGLHMYRAGLNRAHP